MPRYNPNNKQHRKTLAKRIAKMLKGSGFSLEGPSRNEDVYYRDVDGVSNGSAKIRVLTSILNGEMRTVGEDAIRVCAVYTNSAGQSRGLVKSTRINRTGDMEAITGRLLEAMRKTYSTARKRANDEGFLALPVKPSKKRWVPRKKKTGSKPKTARRLNTAVKAAAPPAPGKEPFTYVFKVGDLVQPLGVAWPPAPDVHRKGIVKSVVEQELLENYKITVFWLDEMSERTISAKMLVPLAA